MFKLLILRVSSSLGKGLKVWRDPSTFHNELSAVYKFSYPPKSEFCWEIYSYSSC